MNIRIYSKKSFAIGPGATRGTSEIDCFKTVPGTFQDMPSMYENDPLFKLAVKCGDITIINNSSVEKKVDGTDAEINDEAKMTPVQEYYETLKVMNTEQAIIEGEKFGIEREGDEKLASFKKRIMEAYKLQEE